MDAPRKSPEFSIEAGVRPYTAWSALAVTKLHHPRRSHQNSTSRSLRYRKRAIFVLALYIPMVIVPFALTVVLTKRPIGASSYSKTNGFPLQDVYNMRNWKTAVDVMNSITGLITIPILSSLLSQAAVVFAQRRKPKQVLAVKHLFALADRGWSDISILSSSIRWREPGAMSCKCFLFLAASLIIIGAVQQPLYQILVDVETVPVATCADTFYYTSNTNCHWPHGQWPYNEIGTDIEPSQIALIDHDVILLQLISDIASVSADDPQPNLWVKWDAEEPNAEIEARKHSQGNLVTLRDYVFQWPLGSYDSQNDFFVASIQAGSTTGVLREHAMRLNSSIKCDAIDSTQFPTFCEGINPFSMSWERGNESEVRVCVPGEIGVFPWSRSRNRQDITEELFLHIHDNESNADEDPHFQNISTTLHCKAATTRSYFELGNSYNHDGHSPIMNKWPSRNEMEKHFDDFIDGGSFVGSLQGTIPSEEDTAEISKTGWNMSGPLMLSAMSLFGNASWFNATTDFLSSSNLETLVTLDDNSTLLANLSTNSNSKISWKELCAGLPFGRLGFGLSNIYLELSSGVCDQIQRSLLHTHASLDEESMLLPKLKALINRWLKDMSEPETLLLITILSKP